MFPALPTAAINAIFRGPLAVDVIARPGGSAEFAARAVLFGAPQIGEFRESDHIREALTLRIRVSEWTAKPAKGDIIALLDKAGDVTELRRVTDARHADIVRASWRIDTEPGPRLP